MENWAPWISRHALASGFRRKPWANAQRLILELAFAKALGRGRRQSKLREALIKTPAIAGIESDGLHGASGDLVHHSIRFPLGLSRRDHNWLATHSVKKRSALRRACPGGSTTGRLRARSIVAFAGTGPTESSKLKNGGVYPARSFSVVAPAGTGPTEAGEADV